MTETNSLRSAIDSGRDAHRRGDLVAARDHYVRALEIHSDDADVLHSLAQIELKLGHLRLAESHQREAIKINRYGVGFQNQLGDILLARKRLRDAEAAYFEELRMRPDFSASHYNLGQLMLRADNVKRAIKHLQSAVQFNPEYVEASALLGYALIEDEQLKPGLKWLQTALKINPQYATTYSFLGHLNAKLKRTKQAEAHFSKALKLDPENIQALSGAGDLHERRGELSRAIASFNRVLEIDDENVAVTRALASIWERQGVWSIAEKYYQRAHKLAPSSIDILHDLADVQLKRRDLAGTIVSYEKALQIRPSDQRSLAQYGRLKALTGDTKLALSKLSTVVQGGIVNTDVLCSYAQLLSAASRSHEGIALLEQRLRGNCSNEEQCLIHFTLGNLHDVDSSYDLAFHNYRKGNLLKQARFNAKDFDEHCTKLIEQFSAENLANAPRVGNSGEGLTFMIGMPRSGVRVIEKYLQGADEVTTSGSTPFVETTAYRMSSRYKQQWPANVVDWDIEALSKYARLYTQRSRIDDADATIFLDATWRNFLYVGLIEMMFPRARLIYCARDYRDVALSCYCNDHGQNHGAAFSYNLRDIAAYIRSHKKVMAHWAEVISLPMHVVSYERMILEFDEETAALKQFLDLPEGLVDEPEDGVRLPKPSSLRSTSLRRYRHYRNHLESFVEDLGSPPDKPF